MWLLTALSAFTFVDELPGSGGDDRRRPLFNSSSHPQGIQGLHVAIVFFLLFFICTLEHPFPVPDEHQPKIHEPPPDTVGKPLLHCSLHMHVYMYMHVLIT